MPSPALRLAICLAPAKFGGLESSVLSLSKGLKASGVDVRLILSVDLGVTPAIEAAALKEHLPVERLEQSSRAYFREFTECRRLLRQHSVTLVHTHGYRADLVHGIAARSLGIPVVTTFHGFTGGSARNRIYEFLQRLAATRAAAVVAVSRVIARDLIAFGVRASRVFHQPNAFAPPTHPQTRAEARVSLGEGTAGLVVGWVGRLSQEKGPDIFLQALARLPASTPHLTALIIGDGPMRQQLESAASGLPANARARFVGFVPNAAALIPALDLLVLSSRTEGTPVTILEAMASNVPIVSFSVGGIPELLTEADSYLVTDHTPQSLSNAISQALNDRAERAVRAHRAQERLIACFNNTEWTARHLEIYVGAMRASSAPAR